MEKIDQLDLECQIHAARLAGEIERMMIDLQTMDPDAMLRLEQLMSRMRIRTIVERHCH